ncbi:MAG TPA: hypothetical protein ENK66_07435 [Arcobacter sp.]|nr:hypothetical protein [Arcobacter sp.]
MKSIIQIIFILYLNSFLYAKSHQVTTPIELLKEPVYNEFKKYLNYNNVENIEDKQIVYYKYSSYENLKNAYEPIKFFNKVLKKDTLRMNYYVEAHFKDKIPIRCIIHYEDGNYIDIELDSSGKAIREYNSYTKSILVHIFRQNNLIYIISCNIESKQKVCYIDYTFESPNAPHYEAVKIYKEFPNKMLRRDQYQKLIKEKILEKSSKDFFQKLLEEENVVFTKKIHYFKNYESNIKFSDITTSTNNQYIKVFYKHQKPFKAHWYSKNKLTKSVELNEQEQITKVIDFKFLTIKEYKYHDKRIDEIECLYLQGTCSIREVEQVKM